MQKILAILFLALSFNAQADSLHGKAIWCKSEPNQHAEAQFWFVDGHVLQADTIEYSIVKHDLGAYRADAFHITWADDHQYFGGALVLYRLFRAELRLYQEQTQSDYEKWYQCELSSEAEIDRYLTDRINRYKEKNKI